MLFYTSLFIASLFAAFVGLWAYHAFRKAGQAIFKSVLPGAKTGPASHLGPAIKRSTKKRASRNGTQTPWGWKSHTTPTNLAKTHAAKPTAVRQNPYIVAKPKTNHKADMGWVRREEKSELGGKAYKVTRGVSATAEGFKDADRPWGW
jgi:hypothetical protein